MFTEERAKQLEEVQSVLGHYFNTISFLNKALTHKSYANENNEGLKNNERLEFLGDAVIDLVISDYFFKRFSSYAEGPLTKIRAALVNETTLSKIARNLRLGEFILLGKGEDMTGGKDKASILANTFEAIIAAIYLDTDINKVYSKILDYLKEDIERIISESSGYIDYKSNLQEYTQHQLNCRPFYEVLSETGPDHSKIFEIIVTVKNKKFGCGAGKSKKEAEQEAARQALERLSKKEEVGTL